VLGSKTAADRGSPEPLLEPVVEPEVVLVVLVVLRGVAGATLLLKLEPLLEPLLVVVAVLVAVVLQVPADGLQRLWRRGTTGPRTKPCYFCACRPICDRRWPMSCCHTSTARISNTVCAQKRRPAPSMVLVDHRSAQGMVRARTFLAACFCRVLQGR